MNANHITRMLAVALTATALLVSLIACGTTPGVRSAPGKSPTTGKTAAVSYSPRFSRSLIRHTVPAKTSTPAPAKPAIAFTFTKQAVVSGARPQLSYSGANMPDGSRLFLELAYGTPPQWTYVEPLTATTGTASISALPPGLYRFRITALSGVTTAATSPAQTLSVTAPPNSSCDICQFFGGVGGAVAGWILDHALPWLLDKLPW